MCTLTFVPTEDGYLAGMNRDELFSRPRALPPKIFVKDAMEMVYPREPSGGTWIACNSKGNVLALLNWNGNESYNLGEKTQDACLVIPELAVSPIYLRPIPIFGARICMGCFLSVWLGFFRNERIINEWRWDGMARRKLEFSWARKHWFSSSLSDSLAEKGGAGRAKLQRASPRLGAMAGFAAFIARTLPGQVPFSVCVHRQGCGDRQLHRGTVWRNADLDGLSRRANPCMKNGFDEFCKPDPEGSASPQQPAQAPNLMKLFVHVPALTPCASKLRRGLRNEMKDKVVLITGAKGGLGSFVTSAFPLERARRS